MVLGLRPKLVVQTQTAEPEARGLCGLLSVNNALQQYDFLNMAAMREELARLEVLRPGQDHGSPQNGGYSMLALHRGLQTRGYWLIHLNRCSFLHKKCKKEWASRVISSSFSRLLIIGMPTGQVGDIYHCVASTMFNGKRWIIDPDEGKRAVMSESTLREFLPTISSVYAIVTHEEHGMYQEMFRRRREKVQRRAAAAFKPAETRRARRRNQLAIQKAAIGVEVKRASVTRARAAHQRRRRKA